MKILRNARNIFAIRQSEILYKTDRLSLPFHSINSIYLTGQVEQIIMRILCHTSQLIKQTIIGSLIIVRVGIIVGDGYNFGF